MIHMDWAAEIAKKLVGPAAMTRPVWPEEVAKALRKAKAEGEVAGLEMAADTVNAHKFVSWPPATAAGLAATILESVIRTRAADHRAASKLTPTE